MTYSLSHMFRRRSGRVTDGRLTETRGAVLIPLTAILVILVVAIGAYRLGELNRFICDGPCSATYVEPPDALGQTVDVTGAGPPLSTAGPADAAKVAAAVQSPLTRSSLGPHVGFIALDPKTGATLAISGSGVFTPASTTKVLTAYAALKSMDAGTRFATTVVQPAAGSIVLVGGGDPFLTTKAPKPNRYAFSANLTELASQTAAALKAASSEKGGTISVSLSFDDSLFSGPSASSGWETSYVAGNIVTPVSALWTDEGVGSNGIRARNPAAAAAVTFATLLGKHGIAVKASAQRMEAPADASEIARVESAPLRQILESLVQRSDNEAAEVMLRHVAKALGMPGTFVDGTTAVKTLLDDGGIDTTGLELYDGSGLSRDNRVSPLTLAETIRASDMLGRIGSLMSDLPIAGFNGSLTERFQGVAAKVGLGLVHAKTGTLTGVHSIAGFVSDAEGSPIVFAIMADRTGKAPPLVVQAALDDVAAALAGCHCSP